jgi:hypothetical protein
MAVGGNVGCFSETLLYQKWYFCEVAAWNATNVGPAN